MLVDVLAPDDKQCKRLLRPRDPNPQRPDPMRIQRLTLEDNNMINFFDIHGSQDRTAFIYASVVSIALVESTPLVLTLLSSRMCCCTWSTTQSRYNSTKYGRGTHHSSTAVGSR